LHAPPQVRVSESSFLRCFSVLSIRACLHPARRTPAHSSFLFSQLLFPLTLCLPPSLSLPAFSPVSAPLANSCLQYLTLLTPSLRHHGLLVPSLVLHIYLTSLSWPVTCVNLWLTLWSAHFAVMCYIDLVPQAAVTVSAANASIEPWITT
jgi:hypothetical protein